MVIPSAASPSLHDSDRVQDEVPAPKHCRQTNHAKGDSENGPGIKQVWRRALLRILASLRLGGSTLLLSPPRCHDARNTEMYDTRCVFGGLRVPGPSGLFFAGRRGKGAGIKSQAVPNPWPGKQAPRGRLRPARGDKLDPRAFACICGSKRICVQFRPASTIFDGSSAQIRRGLGKFLMPFGLMGPALRLIPSHLEERRLG